MAGRISRGRVVGALSAALLAGGATAYATVGDVGANAVPASPSPTSSTAPAVPASTGTPSPTSAPSPTGTAGTAGTAPAAAPRPTVTARDARITPAAATAAPVRLQVAQIGLDLPVVPEAVAGDGQMALPPTPFEAGWYRYGPAPGDRTGASVIAAHVDTRDAGVGPMAGLGSVRPGASVVVTSADGTRHTYRVESVRSVAKTSLDLRALFARTGSPRLHLVTCGGEYDHVARHYEANVVVVAVPVGA